MMSGSILNIVLKGSASSELAGRRVPWAKYACKPDHDMPNKQPDIKTITYDLACVTGGY
jgi:hypothetical protein